MRSSGLRHSYKNFVRVDMEDSTCTTDTIDVFQAAHREFPNTGLVVQAYLFRTEADVRALAAEKTNFRLCKGIYKEAPGDRLPEARGGPGELSRSCSASCSMPGATSGIATHDTVLVDAAYAIIAKRGLQKDQYEFQMLLGVRPELAESWCATGTRSACMFRSASTGTGIPRAGSRKIPLWRDMCSKHCSRGTSDRVTRCPGRSGRPGLVTLSLQPTRSNSWRKPTSNPTCRRPRT